MTSSVLWIKDVECVLSFWTCRQLSTQWTTPSYAPPWKITLVLVDMRWISLNRTWLTGLSAYLSLIYGVPQGSVLGSIEFCIYTLPLSAILKHCKIDYHIYADDMQIYCSFDAESLDEVLRSLDNCISDIRSWMITNKLKINDSKTEFLLITSPRSKFTKDIQITIG